MDTNALKDNQGSTLITWLRKQMHEKAQKRESCCAEYQHWWDLVNNHKHTKHIMSTSYLLFAVILFHSAEKHVLWGHPNCDATCAEKNLKCNELIPSGWGPHEGVFIEEFQECVVCSSERSTDYWSHLGNGTQMGPCLSSFLLFLCTFWHLSFYCTSLLDCSFGAPVSSQVMDKSVQGK